MSAKNLFSIRIHHFLYSSVSQENSVVSLQAFLIMENGNGNHESNITVIDSKSVKYLLTKLRDRNTLSKVGFIHDLDPKKRVTLSNKLEYFQIPKQKILRSKI